MIVKSTNLKFFHNTLTRNGDRVQQLGWQALIFGRIFYSFIYSNSLLLFRFTPKWFLLLLRCNDVWWSFMYLANIWAPYWVALIDECMYV